MLRLRGHDVDLVVDPSHGAPVIVHWGAALADHTDLEALAVAVARPIVGGTADTEAPLSVVPEHGSGFPGRPGLRGHRPGGSAWAPRFRPQTSEQDGGRLVTVAVDDTAELQLTVTFDLAAALVVRAAVTNLSADRPYLLHGLDVSLPLPAVADELLTFHGRWTREFHTRRLAWPIGTVGNENRRGRTSHEHPPLVFAGRSGFGEWRGPVWGAHLAWSGNHRIAAERLADGRRFLQLGELLHPGEIALSPGETYETPEIIAVYGHEGLTGAGQQFHRHLRSRPTHPTTPRPVLVNTWEAVYFDHSADRLRALADCAAAIGAERFVLDDGWFGSRRDDTSGLGDWVVSADAHPDGLGPLIEHVTSLGMDFGLWVEPEMVNPDSDLYRAHPEWTLTTDGAEPVLYRRQLVLDLAWPEAFDHVLGRLDALLADHDIAYLKWDMNRDHIGGSGRDGAPGTHAQTLAVYRLLDELRRRHPGVEIESCASGGARIDHEILRRTERVWTSDSNDALERQEIQRGASLLIPPELMGAHIGPPRSHTTGRRHGLAFRGATAMFGHLGIEWDLLSLDDRELDRVRRIVEVHRRFRPLLHTGDVVRFDTDDTVVAHGVYAADRSEALVSVAVVRSAPGLSPAPMRLPGLDAEAVYEVTLLDDPAPSWTSDREPPPWVADGLRLDGRALAVVGVQLPALLPETAAVLHVRRREPY